MWGPTIYSNTLSILPMAIIGVLAGEPGQLRDVTWSTETVLLIFSSCVVGVAISYTGFKCRSLVTATCFTVLGVANKMLTVLANVLLWDKHATPLGIGCLALCLIAASAYQQAPMRPGARSLLGSGEERSNEGER
jgi:GDP-mannose transporter